MSRPEATRQPSATSAPAITAVLSSRHARSASPAQPAHELVQHRPRVLQVRPRQHADRVHGSTAFRTRASNSSSGIAAAPATRCTKNSRLPSAPVTGEAHAAAHAEAEALRGLRHVAQRLAVQLLVLHEPAAADLRASDLELRLHEHDRVGARPQHES